MAVLLEINGAQHSVDVDGSTPLLWVLRDVLGLVGSKYGCGAGLCGACTVHLDGRPTRSCGIPVSRVQGRAITTIEGVGASEIGSRVQAAWLQVDVAQCGYCQAGQIMGATALLASTPKPSDDDINRHMRAYVCRCGTYNRIRAAIRVAAGEATSGGPGFGA